jgi:tetratricopeptide (TPR) repeat protein
MGLTRTGVLVLMVLSLTVDLSFDQSTAKQIYTKGLEFAVQGKFDEAKEEFEKTLKIESFNEKAKEALKVIKDVDEQKLKHEAVMNFFKGIAYSKNKNWTKSITEFNKAIELNPRFSEAYCNRAIAYRPKGEHDKSLFDFKRAIEIRPKYARPYNSRGLTYMSKREYDKAISDYNKAIEISSRFAKAYMNRGNTYYLKGQYDKAISDFTKSIEINEKLARAYNLRGFAYIEKGQWNQAISDHTKAIELRPKEARAYIFRGSVYMVHLGNNKKACSDWKRACELGSCKSYELAKRNGDC